MSQYTPQSPSPVLRLPLPANPVPQTAGGGPLIKARRMDRIATARIQFPRLCKWCAYHEHDEDRVWHRGWGRTEAEALEDLARLDQERAEAEEDDDYDRAAEDAQRRADAKEGF